MSRLLLLMLLLLLKCSLLLELNRKHMVVRTEKENVPVTADVDDELVRLVRGSPSAENGHSQ